MNFTNYSDFRAAVLKLIDGDDASGSLSTATLDLLIGLGESRVYHGDDTVSGLRSRDMESALSVAVTSNTAALPSDCLELTRVQFSGEEPLVYMPEDEVLRQLDRGASGTTYAYAQQGGNLLFLPEASGTVGGRYFKRPADIKTGGLHATFNRYPECFLFGAVSEAAPFIGEDARLPMWKKLWQGWMESAHRSERQRATAGGKLTVKAR